MSENRIRIVHTTFDVEAARHKVAAFEAEHGTNDPVVAFRDVEGRLIETDDFHDWQSLTLILRRIDSWRAS